MVTSEGESFDVVQFDSKVTGTAPINATLKLQFERILQQAMKSIVTDQFLLCIGV